MAVIHSATMRPNKLELVAGWLPERDWFDGDADAIERAAAYRFDDPDGEVGVETILLRAGEAVYQLPLTYRGAPLEGAQAWLIGTSEHSVLGTRWVYDAVGDPVYAAALARAILADADQAEQFESVDGRLEPLAPSMSIASAAGPEEYAPEVRAVERVEDGDPTLVVADTVEFTIARRLGGQSRLPGTVLTGTWGAASAPLASARLRA